MNGRTVAWAEARPLGVAGSAEAPIVLVPGLWMSWRAYRWLIPHLSRVRRVITADPPGCGRSAPLPGAPDAAAQADHLLAWLDLYGVRSAHLVGHSFGALTVARAAARRPEVIRSAVLASPSPDPTLPRARAHLAALARDALREPPRTLVQAATDYARSRPTIATGFLAEAHDRPGDLVGDALVPVHVVRGSRDRVAGQTWCQALAEAAPDGVASVIAGAPHGLPQHSPRRLARLVLDHAARAEGAG